MAMQRLKNKKLIWITSLMVLLLVLILGGILIFGKQEGYRTVKVFEISGRVGVVKDGVEYEAYSGMVLTEGYSIVTSSDSYVRLVLDGDKYIKLEEGSKATFEKLGMLGSGKTTINLERGAILSEVVNPLKADESYIVNTPNAVLAVRGTLFKVSVNVNEKGESNTNIYTYGGAVGSKRIEPNGNVIDEQVVIDAGYKTSVKMDDVETIYVIENTDNINSSENKERINVIDISDEDMVDIYFASKNGHEMFIATDKIEEELELRGVDVTEEKSVYDKAERLDKEKNVTSIDDGDFLLVDNDEENNEENNDVIGDGGHRHEEVTTIEEATCLEEGKKTVICKECGELISERVLAALGHEEADANIVKHATCSEDGLQHINCVRCEALVREEVIEAIEHQEVLVGTKEVHTKCSTCDVVLSTSHNYTTSVIKEATCKEQGELAYACGCGYNYVERTAKVEHKEKTNTTDATCLEDGKVVVSCELCNTIIREEKIAGKHIKANANASTSTCSRCGVKLVDFSSKNFPDSVFFSLLKADGIDSNSDGFLDEKEINAVTDMRYHYAGISDFTGLEYFTELTYLELVGNNASKIPFENLTKLELLNLGYTNITSADVTKHTNLESLQLYGTDISSIDLSNNTKLIFLSLADCSNLTSLSLDNNKMLEHIQLQSTGLTDFQISGYTSLQEVWLTNCTMEKVRIMNCSNLTRIELPNGASTVDVSGCTSLLSLNLSNLKGTLYSFTGDNSGLRGVIDLSNSQNLQEVSFDNCKGITGVNVSDCDFLSTLSVANSGALYVDADNCISLYNIDVSNNKYLVGLGTETVDFSAVEGFESSKLGDINGGSFSSGVFTFNEGSTQIVYRYHIANGLYGEFIIEQN